MGGRFGARPVLAEVAGSVSLPALASVTLVVAPSVVPLRDSLTPVVGGVSLVSVALAPVVVVPAGVWVVTPVVMVEALSSALLRPPSSPQAALIIPLAQIQETTRRFTMVIPRGAS